MKTNPVVLLMTFLVTAGLPAMADSIRACPSWQVTVVDEKGAPMGNVSVTQEWGCDVAGTMVIETANAMTDGKGKTALPERFLKPPDERTFKKWVMQLNSPNRTRPWTTLTIWKQGYALTRVSALSNPNVVWTRDGLETRVVLPRWKPGS